MHKTCGIPNVTPRDRAGMGGLVKEGTQSLPLGEGGEKRERSEGNRSFYVQGEDMWFVVTARMCRISGTGDDVSCCHQVPEAGHGGALLLTRAMYYFT